MVGRGFVAALIVGLGLPAAAGAAPSDGGLIAYDDGRSLYTIASTGGTPTRIGTGTLATWAPDGRRLAFIRDGGLWVSRASGAGARRLIRGVSAAAWSPTGRRFGYVIRGGISVARTDGTHATRLVDMSFFTRRAVGDAALASPTWSPDGRRLAFLFYDTGAISQTVELMVISARRGARVQRVATGANVGSGPTLTGGSLSWSPDGASLATDAATFGTEPTPDSQPFNPQLGPPYVMAVDLTGTQTPLQPAGAAFTEAAWSSTGQALCGVTTTGLDANGVAISAIATYAVASNTLTPLATIPAAQYAAPSGCAWQPQG